MGKEKSELDFDDLCKGTVRKSFTGCRPNLEDKSIMRDALMVGGMSNSYR